jgi:hypothetical protein
VALGAPGARPGEQLEATVEVLRDLTRGERPDARRRQLDRERQPVEALADVSHGLRVAVAQLEVPDREPRPVGEQLDGLRPERA